MNSTLKTPKPPVVRTAASVHSVRSYSPAHLDLLAGIELQHGHPRAAEHLSRIAAEQREHCAAEALS